MLGTLLVVLALAAPPGGASRLAPGPEPDPPEIAGVDAPAPVQAPGGFPVAPGGGAIVVAAGALVAAARRRASLLASPPSPGLGLGLKPPEDVIVVFVPGYGSPSSAETFSELIDLMGLPDAQVRHFDYRWVNGVADHAEAARSSDVGEAAAALSGFASGVAGGGSEVHLVGHSKGGAVIAEMIERWDRGALPRVDGITGATLLDPPLADGLHGLAQSVGTFLEWLDRQVPFVDLPGLANDGGYDPKECALVVLDCTDFRAGLGDVAGVDVAVVRSPDAAITNFADVPDALPVYEVDTPGPSAVSRLPDPIAAIAAVVAAHNAVLAHPDVAACVVARMSADPCRLTDISRSPNPAALTDRTGGTGLAKIA